MSQPPVAAASRDGARGAEPAMAGSSTILRATLARYGGRVREALREWLPAQEPRRHLYDLVADYPLRQGKMLRPSLCIAACRAFGGTIEDALDSAVAIELMHNAFLIHDDIEDGSALRRGGPALQIAHGVPLALNAGDGMTILSIRPLLRNLDRLAPAVARQILSETLSVAQQTVEGQAIEL